MDKRADSSGEGLEGKGILVLMGPSGSGKTESRKRLMAMDERFRLIPALTTRPKRDKEVDRISVSESTFLTELASGELLAVNEIYGHRYGTPRRFIQEQVDLGNWPLLDWPLNCVKELDREFPGTCKKVYLKPTSDTELAARLSKDGRDPDGARLSAALAELQAIEADEWKRTLDLIVHSDHGREQEIARAIYAYFVRTVAL